MKSNIRQFMFTSLLALASIGAQAQVNKVTVDGETDYLASRVSFDASHMYIHLTTGDTTTIDLTHDGFALALAFPTDSIGLGDAENKPDPDEEGKIWINAPAVRFAAQAKSDADYLCSNPAAVCALVIDDDHAFPVALSPSVSLKATGYEVSFADGKVFNILNATAAPYVSMLHTAVTDSAVSVTCTTTGLTEGSHCAVCGEQVVAQEETPAAGHALVAEGHCTRCGISYPVLQLGNNTGITLHAVGTDNKEISAGYDSLNLYLFVAPADGELTVSSSGNGDSYGALFDASQSERLEYNDDGNDSNSECDFKFTYTVTKGSSYFIGARAYYEDIELTGYTITVGFVCSSHNVDMEHPVDSVASTCTDPGHIACYQCKVCGKGFDKEGNEIADEDYYLSSLGHALDAEGHCTRCGLSYLVLQWGDNTGITLHAVDTEDNGTVADYDSLNLYLFVAPADGDLTVSSRGEGDSYGALFDASQSKRLEYDDDSNSYNDFMFTYTVTKGSSYYIGARAYDRNTELTDYTITVGFCCTVHADTVAIPDVAATCSVAGHEGGTWCSACHTVFSASTVLRPNGDHTDADKDLFCDVCGRWAETEKPVLVTAQNCDSLRLDSVFVGYYAISNKKQLLGFADMYSGGVCQAKESTVEESGAGVKTAPSVRQAGARRIPVPETGDPVVAQSFKYVLTADITVNDSLFTADGTINDCDSAGNFRTDLLCWMSPSLSLDDVEIIFDGNGHTISGLYQNDSKNDKYGFIGNLSSAGTICNLGISQSYFSDATTTSASAGSIVAYSAGVVRNCWSDAVMDVFIEKQGGLIGEMIGGSVVGSCFTGSISVYNCAGGIVGVISDNKVVISDCQFSGQFKRIENRNATVAGIVYDIQSSIDSVLIEKCCADGDFCLNNRELSVYGIAGDTYIVDGFVQISNCYNKMQFIGNGKYGFWGLAGYVYTDSEISVSDYFKVSHCFNYGTYSDATDYYPVFDGDGFAGSAAYCYTLGESDDYCESASLKDFASGKIACLLNEGNEDPVWYQELGIDKHPVLKGDEYTVVFEDEEGSYCNHYCNLNSLTITDGEVYEMKHITTIDSLIYSRTVKESQAGKWQALYVPFQIESDSVADLFDIAAINNFHEYYDANGNIVDRELEVRLVKGAKTRANYPYLIRPKSAGQMDILFRDVNVYWSESNSISCASTDTRYTFTGTYQPIARIDTDSLGYVFMGGGQLSQTSNHNAVLSAQRWYLTVEDYNSLADAYRPVEMLSSAMRIVLLDEEETGIETVNNGQSALDNAIYNLQGQKLNALQTGINIVRSQRGGVQKMIVE